jgi:hypothetical protein
MGSSSVKALQKEEEEQRKTQALFSKMNAKEEKADIRRIADTSPLVQTFGCRLGSSFLIYARNAAGKEICSFTTDPVNPYHNPSIRYTYTPRGGNSPVSLYTLMVTQCRMRNQPMMSKAEAASFLEITIGEEVKIGY